MDIVTYALLNGKIKDYASNVDEWLEENVDPATGYVLDRSLQMENAAAPADIVGDINDDVGELRNTLNSVYRSYASPSLYDVSAYASGTIVAGFGFVSDSVIPAGTLIKTVRLYSGASSSTEATIVIINSETSVCTNVKRFVCDPGWNTVALNWMVSAPVRIGSYNSQPIFTYSASGDYVFSANGLGSFLPATPNPGDAVEIGKDYSGTFGLAFQWEITSGILSDADLRLANAEANIQAIEPVALNRRTPVMYQGFYVYANSGELNPASWASYSDYYSVDVITDLYAAMGEGVGCCYYTFDKQFISGFDGGLSHEAKWHVLTPPDGAVYVRFSNRNATLYDNDVLIDNRINHRLENAANDVCATSYAPTLFDDVSSYSGGTIVSGISVIADAVIPSGTMIYAVRVYSGVNAVTAAKIAIISNVSNTCLKVVPFNCNSGWNVIEVNDSFAEDVKIGICNASPLFITGSSQEYIFSSGGLGRFLPADITLGETVTISKEYSGDFALSVQWETSIGKLPDAEYALGLQVKKAKIENTNILSMYDTFICIGDSLTYSQVFVANGTTEGTNRQAFKTYPQVLASLCGGVSYNYATPGDTGVLWWQRSSTGAFNHHGLYIVFLGTNYGFTDTIDTDCPGDNPDNFNKATNTGAYGAILQTIKNNGDKAVLITPWGGGGDSLITTKAVIDKFSAKYEFPVIDVDAPERTAAAYHLYPDGTGQDLLHFNDLGYAWFANEVKNQINQLSYADKFKIMRTQ
jgi:hypothetical protein